MAGVATLVAMAACGGSPRLPEAQATDEAPEIFPDYREVTFPINIAPPNFQLNTPHDDAYAQLRAGDEEVVVKEREDHFEIPERAWRQLVESGETVEVTLYAQRDGRWTRFPAFRQYISKDSIDARLVYRLIEPGYEMWHDMGIYQRDLSSYEQTPIMENRLTDQNCMNCHSFNQGDPNQLIFHMRGANGGTFLVKNGQITKLNTKTPETITSFVYPSWHPGGRYIAFSLNETMQSFHLKSRNRAEIYDGASDVVVFDTETNQVISLPLLTSEARFENTPAFSPDGRRLYFCTAVRKEVPKEYDQVRFDLCAIDFDPATGTLGNHVDTILKVSDKGKSVSFPRISPDGRKMLFALADYGYFLIWNKRSDLYLLDLETGALQSLDAANSADSESFHSWSSNGRWIVFSSRREDGLYTRPYFAHIDEQGRAGKAFLLPQRDPATFYHRLMKSFNVPELTKGPVPNMMRQLAIIAKEDPGVQVTFRK